MARRQANHGGRFPRRRARALRAPAAGRPRSERLRGSLSIRGRTRRGFARRARDTVAADAYARSHPASRGVCAGRDLPDRRSWLRDRSADGPLRRRIAVRRIGLGRSGDRPAATRCDRVHVGLDRRTGAAPQDLGPPRRVRAGRRRKARIAGRSPAYAGRHGAAAAHVRPRVDRIAAAAEWQLVHCGEAFLIRPTSRPHSPRRRGRAH